MASTPGLELHRVEPGSRVRLADVDPGDTSAAPGDKEATREALRKLRHRLRDLQGRLWAEADRKVLLVLQGVDTSGKGGTVEHVLGAAHPAGLKVVAFSAPTEQELARDYLWRVHASVPQRGQLAVFDRSHYEDVLIARVDQLVPEAVWRRRYDHINAFEQLLVDEGTVVVKVLLHPSREEQRERLQARLDDPRKRWKLRVEDLQAREHWDAYQAAFDDVLHRTSTEHAPWHLVPADRKWYRNWAVATILVGALEAMDLRWPEPTEDLSTVVIPE